MKASLASLTQNAHQPNFIEENRRAQIIVPNEVLRFDPFSLLDLFARRQLLVTRAEMHFHTDSIEYTFFSPRLPRIARGALSPIYELEEVGKVGEPGRFDIRLRS